MVSVALYAVGDVQGCFLTLERLLGRIRFDPGVDRLWMTGDLVNRGPRSLDVLRLARSLDPALVCVLGNHDLHLLGRARGVRPARRGDTLDAVLRAPDRDELVAWLARRPLLHRDGPRLLVHAGLQPAWTPSDAERIARGLEERLQGPAADSLLAGLSRRGLPGWQGARESDRDVLALQTFTLLRACGDDGRLCREFSGPPAEAPPGCRAWFTVPGRRSEDAVVVCGHWSALGLRLETNLVALDTGCVWGGPLTAVRLDDGALFQEPFAD
jgi:bis(5'-nucleosyl)-tetraphosphatase (symmetrical)